MCMYVEVALMPPKTRCIDGGKPHLIHRGITHLVFRVILIIGHQRQGSELTADIPHVLPQSPEQSPGVPCLIPYGVPATRRYKCLVYQLWPRYDQVSHILCRGIENQPRITLVWRPIESSRDSCTRAPHRKPSIELERYDQLL